MRSGTNQKSEFNIPDSHRGDKKVRAVWLPTHFTLKLSKNKNKIKIKMQVGLHPLQNS
jgi:hypothetical protein